MPRFRIRVSELRRDQALVWVIAAIRGTSDVPTPVDSVVVIRAAIAALGDQPLQVVLTTGYQELPQEFETLPRTFVTPPTCRVLRWQNAAI